MESTDWKEEYEQNEEESQINTEQPTTPQRHNQHGKAEQEQIQENWINTEESMRQHYNNLKRIKRSQEDQIKKISSSTRRIQTTGYDTTEQVGQNKSDRTTRTEQLGENQEQQNKRLDKPSRRITKYTSTYPRSAIL